MIRAMLFDPESGRVEKGGEELLQRWHESAAAPRPPLIWVDFAGRDLEQQADLMYSVFGLHEYAIEDAQRDRHPPKFESYAGFTFLLLKGLDKEGEEFGTIQIAFFLAETFLVTRHAEDSVSLDALWTRLEAEPDLFREGTGRLFTVATRRIVDRYVDLLLELENRLDELEEEMRSNPNDELLAELSGYKSELKRVTRIFTYHDRIFNQLRHHATGLFSGDLVHDVNDVYDRMERAASLATLYHDIASDLIDSYISIASHRLNGIMKILTIITAIFVPLSFIAGLYGMNFDSEASPWNMPELRAYFGYPIFLLALLGIGAGMLWWFKRRKWL